MYLCVCVSTRAGGIWRVFRARAADMRVRTRLTGVRGHRVGPRVARAAARGHRRDAQPARWKAHHRCAAPPPPPPPLRQRCDSVLLLLGRRSDGDRGHYEQDRALRRVGQRAAGVCVCVCVCVCVRARMCLHLCVRVVARGVWVCVLVWSHRFGRTCLLFTVARRRRAFVDR